MTDPNVITNPDGSTVVLEPGDPGYVDPTLPVEGESTVPPPPESGVTNEPELPVEVPAGADLTFQREVGESDAEFMARTRNVVAVSESPTDIVPNTPQITMGVQVPVENAQGEVIEGVVTSVPAEVVIAAEEAAAEEPAPEEPPAEEPAP